MATPNSSSSNPVAHAAHGNGHGKVGLPGLVVGALGVVFGDIGTSDADLPFNAARTVTLSG